MKIKKILIIVNTVFLFSGCVLNQMIEKSNKLRTQLYLTPDEYTYIHTLNDDIMYDLNLLREPFSDGIGAYYLKPILLEKSYSKIIDLIRPKSFFDTHPVNGFKARDLREVIYLKKKSIVSFSALDRGQYYTGKYLLSLENKELKMKYLGHYDENKYLFPNSENNQ